MSTSEDIDPRDDRLLALLYGELEGDDDATAREEIGGDDELGARLADYQSLRALYAELPEDEPPAALSHKLLAAAATRKPARRGFFVWLAALVEPIALHPGLAAAASLVLVAGVAGALFATGRGDVAQPSAKSAARAPAVSAEPKEVTSAEAPPEPEPVATEELADVEIASGAEGEAKGEAAAVDNGVVDELAGGERATSKRRAGKAKARPRRASRSRAKPEAKPARPAETLRAPQAQQGRFAEPPPPTERGYGAETTSPTPSPQRPAIGSADAPASPPADVDAEADDANVRADDRKADDGKAETVRELHKRAVRAAGSNECSAVVALGRRVRNLDRRYHDDVFARDERLGACLRAP